MRDQGELNISDKPRTPFVFCETIVEIYTSALKKRALPTASIQARHTDSLALPSTWHWEEEK